MQKNYNAYISATGPFQVAGGTMQAAALSGYNFAVPDTWYNASAEIVTVQSSASTTGITLTVADMLNQVFLRSGLSADATDTTPTAAQLVAAITGIAPNRGFYWTLRNSTAHTVTLGAGTGVTLATGNTNTVATLVARTFLIVFTNVTPGSEAVTIYSLGASTF